MSANVGPVKLRGVGAGRPRRQALALLLLPLTLAGGRPSLAGDGRDAATGATQEHVASARRVDDFSNVDARGRPHSAGEWRGRRAVVLLFLATECPVANRYAPEMARLARVYGPRGVAFYGVYPDPDATAEVALRHAAEFGLDFPALLDPRQRLARQVGARVTPEAAVLGADGRVLYRGRIDDLYTEDGRLRPRATTRDLEDALCAILAGGTPVLAETRAFGCPLPRALSSAAPGPPPRARR